MSYLDESDCRTCHRLGREACPERLELQSDVNALLASGISGLLERTQMLTCAEINTCIDHLKAASNG